MKQKNPSHPKKNPSKFFFLIFTKRESEYLVENFALLLGSGMDVQVALATLMREVRSPEMKRLLGNVKEDIEAGVPLWRALERTTLFPPHSITLIRVGEESGRLSDNLKVVALEMEKERNFRSKIRSAMMYPAFVLTVTAIVGMGVAWFILPRLTLVFSHLRVELPLLTRGLIAFGDFLRLFGSLFIPFSFIIFILFIYFLFFYHKTRHIGQALLFKIPLVRHLIQEIELARLGYLLGTLIDAGLPILDALESLARAATFPVYRNFYEYLRSSIEEGNSFEKSFAAYPKLNRLLPFSVQQLIVGGEQSGHLAKTLIKIGEQFESKADLTTKNLTVILEPILLVIVWIGVVMVALAVILPVYSLLSGLSK